MTETITETSPADYARKLAGFLSADYEGIQVYPATDASDSLYFIVNHESDVVRDGDTWFAREHDREQCHGCEQCGICGIFSQRSAPQYLGPSIHLPEGLTEIAVKGLTITMCRACAVRPVSDVIAAADRIRASQPEDDPWAAAATDHGPF